MTSDRAVCHRCGQAFGRRKGNFPVSYATLYKGVGYLPICKQCVDTMYNSYLTQCNDAKLAVRQMCRKLDLFWSESVFNIVEKKNTTRSMMTQYIAKINSINYAGKSYDDTLSKEGTLWDFNGSAQEASTPEGQHAQGSDAVAFSGEIPEVSDEVLAFWGSGLQPEMYAELEQRREYWMSSLPDGADMDVGTEALIRQICSLELDINRTRARGKSVDKMMTTLDKLIGSVGLKPAQKSQEDSDASLSGTPLGVWLYRYENQRPLPEIDDDLKDVNGIRKYVFTWMGHLCKMLGLKNEYSQLYEDEIKRLSVESPAYDGDDDEVLFADGHQDSQPDGAAE